eukprot:1435231-Pleurochrysis_carterae.AAC.1
MHVGVHVCVARVRCRGCAALPPLLELPLPAHALAGRGGLDVAVLEQKADEKVAVARAVVERVVPLPKRVVRRQRAVDEVREQSVVEVGLADARRRRRVDRSLVVLRARNVAHIGRVCTRAGRELGAHVQRGRTCV